MKKLYELVMMLPQDINEKDRNSVLDHFKKIVLDVKHEHMTDLRPLSYAIKGNKKAYYVTWYIEMDPIAIHDFTNELNLHPKIVRYLVSSAKSIPEDLEIK